MKRGTRSAADADAELREWSIDALVPGGDGIARLSDGRIGFATGAFPGDVVRPIAVEAGKGFVRATRWEIETAGPARVVPACPVAERCGGCDWMALSRDAQAKWKGEIVRTALERAGKCTEPPAVAVVSEEPGTRYRSRVRYHIVDGKVGLFARESHDLVEVPGCLVCHPELDRALDDLRRVDGATLDAFREVELRVTGAPGTERVSVRFFPVVRGGPPKPARTALEPLAVRYDVSVEGDPDAPESDERFELPEGAVLRALPGVFTQVNWVVNAALVRSVVEGAVARGVTRFCDAYAGAGNFTLPLLARGLEGVAIERDRRAVASARRAVRDAGKDPGIFVNADAAAYLKELSRRNERFDVVLLDPPRRGAREVLATLVELGPRYIALCSCDPATFARDAGILLDAGFRFDEVTAFDMFPQTHHVEVLAWMSRAPAADRVSALPPA